MIQTMASRRQLRRDIIYRCCSFVMQPLLPPRCRFSLFRCAMRVIFLLFRRFQRQSAFFSFFCAAVFVFRAAVRDSGVSSDYLYFRRHGNDLPIMPRLNILYCDSRFH